MSQWIYEDLVNCRVVVTSQLHITVFLELWVMGRYKVSRGLFNDHVILCIIKIKGKEKYK
jgi:hypothetical protein